jgi:hypothetical protein
MECKFNRTPYKRKFDNYSGHEDLTVLMQPKKYSEDTFRMQLGRIRRRLQKYLDVGCLQYSTTKSSGACHTRAYGTAHIVYFF